MSGFCICCSLFALPRHWRTTHGSPFISPHGRQMLAHAPLFKYFEHDSACQSYHNLPESHSIVDNNLFHPLWKMRPHPQLMLNNHKLILVPKKCSCWGPSIWYPIINSCSNPSIVLWLTSFTQKQNTARSCHNTSTLHGYCMHVMNINLHVNITIVTGGCRSKHEA